MKTIEKKTQLEFTTICRDLTTGQMHIEYYLRCGKCNSGEHYHRELSVSPHETIVVKCDNCNTRYSTRLELKLIKMWRRKK